MLRPFFHVKASKFPIFFFQKYCGRIFNFIVRNLLSCRLYLRFVTQNFGVCLFFQKHPPNSQHWFSLCPETTKQMY